MTNNSVTIGAVTPQLSSLTSQTSSLEAVQSDGVKHLLSDESATQSTTATGNSVLTDPAASAVVSAPLSEPVQPAVKKFGRFSVDVVKESTAGDG